MSLLLFSAAVIVLLIGLISEQIRELKPKGSGQRKAACILLGWSR